MVDAIGALFDPDAHHLLPVLVLQPSVVVGAPAPVQGAGGRLAGRDRRPGYGWRLRWQGRFASVGCWVRKERTIRSRNVDDKRSGKEDGRAGRSAVRPDAVCRGGCAPLPRAVRSGLMPALAFSENPLPVRVREGSRAMLSKEQVATFQRDGFLVAGDAVDAKQLAGLRAVFTGWVEESRSHDAPFGEPAADGRPRYRPRRGAGAARVRRTRPGPHGVAVAWTGPSDRSEREEARRSRMYGSGFTTDAVPA